MQANSRQIIAGSSFSISETNDGPYPYTLRFQGRIIDDYPTLTKALTAAGRLVATRRAVPPAA